MTEQSAENTLVSVIIPAYNSADFMGETLDSVFAQTFSSLEAIVINDGSADTLQLEQVLQRYSLKPLRYIKQENQGAGAARNAGLRAARGEFVAFLDADDIWLPMFLDKLMALLKRENADLAYADALLVGDARVEGLTFMRVEPSHGPVTPESLLAVTCTVLTSTVLARKSPILAVGLFDTSLRRGQDFDLWLRLAKAGARMVYTPEVLAHHRIVKSGLSGGAISQLERTLSVLETVKAHMKLTKTEEEALEINRTRTLRGLATEVGKKKLLERDFSGALESFSQAQRIQHVWKIFLVCLALRIAPDLLWRLYKRREMARAKSV
jgi:glycosyltransferase involved in cell wall biosynthesis